jgi:hypothetical protein
MSLGSDSPLSSLKPDFPPILNEEILPKSLGHAPKKSVNAMASPYLLYIQGITSSLKVFQRFKCQYESCILVGSHVIGNVKKIVCSIIVPIYKKGDSTLLTNYRHILLLSIFHKILEKFMCSRLKSFFEC